VNATNDVTYDYTFLDGDENKGCFDVDNLWLAERLREYGRCVAVVDARVWDIYGSAMRSYFQHHELGLEVLPLGIDEEQKSLKTVEEAMVFFADVGVMRRETPLVIGGGLITDIVGTACSLYRRSTGYLRLPTTLIGMIDASVAIKVGGNLAEKHKNRIGAFHPHSGVVIDFSFLKSLPEAHVRNGVAELTKISIVEQRECFELLEQHAEDLIKYKFGYADGAPEGLRAVGRTIARKAVLRMLELEAPNLHEHDQHRAIAYGHTWSPAYELTRSPPMHHGHAISTDMCFSATWAAQEGWIDVELRDRVHNMFAKAGLSLYHPCFTADKLHYGTKAILQRRDGDLYAAIPDNQIGQCKYIKVGNFESRAAMDASLEKALEAHQALMQAKFGESCGVGKEPYITEGFSRAKKCSKLELGTWAERLEEMVSEVQESESFETVRDRVQKIGDWWRCSQEYLERHSTTLGKAVQKVLAASKAEKPFPAGMDMNWALDVQSAQTLDFLAGLKRGPVAWDLGTLTGVSAAVLSQHFKRVVTCEREACLAKFAQKHLPANVEVVQSEILAFLEARAAAKEQADVIFMDLDKTCYPVVYEVIQKHELLKPDGMLLVDNVFYRGLPAEIEAGVAPQVSAKTQANADALVKFNSMVQADMKSGAVRALMMPVRDGMLALTRSQPLECAESETRSGSESD